MKPSAVKKAINTCIKAKQPVFVWGSPGIGKSQVIKQIAEKLGLDLIDIRATLLDPVDLRGLPTICKESGVVKWNPPEFLPSKGKGILLLDELNSAPMSVQVACYQLILDRKIGEYVLPEDYIVIAAGNRETDRAITHRMSSALANRFVHIQFEVDFEDWKDWALENEILPEVFSFLKWRPELLNQFNPKKNDKAFPTSRAWEFVSNILKETPDPDVLFPLVCGIVGDGAATEFMAFLDIYKKLPDPQLAIQSPMTADVPTEPSILYAMCGALAHIANKKNFQNIKLYSDRLTPEFRILLIVDCTKKNQGIVNTQAYVDWAVENQKYLL